MLTQKKDILSEAQSISQEIIDDRRWLHRHAEVGLELPDTISYVKSRLIELGYEPQICGKGVVALLKGKNKGKVFLLRADMDALPIKEEADVTYMCKNGNMHACGHDTHTAMLLGAAKLLKEHEDEICGSVKLMFQPAEETFAGAANMIENGVLENPKVDAAMMIHSSTGMPFPEGTIIQALPGVNMASQDAFQIDIRGIGCHGAMPDSGVDPINVACHIHGMLQTLNSREISPNESVVITICMIQSGDAHNILPNSAMMKGSVRTFDSDVRDFVKRRMAEIVSQTAKTLRAEAKIDFYSSCPCTSSDPVLYEDLKSYAQRLLPKDAYMDMSTFPNGGRQSGSEDFGFISQHVPTALFMLSAGNQKNGYVHPMHNPGARFDDSVLYRGSALYADMAISWLNEHC